MRTLIRPAPPSRRTQHPTGHEAIPPVDPYPQQAQWPQADQEQPRMEPEAQPPPSPTMEQITARQVASFIEQNMNSALGAQIHLNHFLVRGVCIPADACDQLAALYQDLADRLREAYS